MKAALVATAFGIAARLSAQVTPLFPDTTFEIAFEQKGSIIAAVNDTLTLAPAPFKMVFTAPVPMGVKLSASFDPASIVQARQGMLMDTIDGFIACCMAEHLFNADRDMIIADSAASYWYYDSLDAHRFDEVALDGPTKRFTRTIDQFFDLDTHAPMPWKDVGGPLHLVFFPDNAPNRRITLVVRWSGP